MKNVNRAFTATNVRVNCRFSYAHVFTPRKNGCSIRITPRFARFFSVHRKLPSGAFYGAFSLPHDTSHITEPQEKA